VPNAVGADALTRETGARGLAARVVRPRTVAFIVCGAVLLAGLVTLLYAASVHAVPGNSDGATVILEGQAMSAGHVTLHHWFLSFDSFWGVDAPLYAIAVLLVGVRPELLNLVPAVIAAAVVVVGMWIARDGRRGWPGAAGALVVFALLALPSHALATFYLQGPLHVGTALWCLLAFVLLCNGRSRWRWALAVVLLTAGSVGDLQTAAFGILPVGIAGLVTAARERRWRAGIWGTTAAVAPVVLALVVREVAKIVGTFTVNKSNPTATHREMLTNLKLAVTYGDKLLGVGSTDFGSGGVPSPLLAVHVLAALAILAGVVAATVSLVRGVLRGMPGAPGDPGLPGGSASIDARVGRDGRGPASWHLDDVLVLAFFGDIAVFVILTPAANPAFARYLTAAVIFGAVLAGRLAARVAAAIASGWARGAATAAAAAAVVATLCFAASTGYTLAPAAPVQPALGLGQFLAAHDLRSGIGDYWSASIVTVESRESVEVRPVTAPFGRVVSYTRNSSSTWYKRHTFQFLVYNTALPFGGVDSQSATATFGPPAHIWSVNGYLVMAWSHPITVVSGAS